MMCVWCKKEPAKYGKVVSFSPGPHLCYDCYKKRAKIKAASILSDNHNWYGSITKEVRK